MIERVVRHVVAFASMLLGGALVFVLVVAMNAFDFGTMDNDVGGAVAFDAPPPKRKPPARKPRPKKAEPKKSRTPPPPMPALAAGLSSFEIDLPFLGEGMLGDSAQGMLGDARDIVMTEDTVDEAPRLAKGISPMYPKRAQARGVTGSVTVSILIGADGSVRDPRVTDARPRGVFEEAALIAVRQWRFEPATYKGRAVSVRYEQTIDFGLE